MKTISDKQTESSRRDGSKSRGPVSSEGKARCSHNAFKLDMNSRLVVLRLRARYVKEWQPEGQRETDLLDDIVNARWPLNRMLSNHPARTLPAQKTRST